MVDKLGVDNPFVPPFLLAHTKGVDYSIFKSRTFWTVVAMFVVGGGNAVLPVIPASWDAALMFVLSGLATYFHINPSQTYTQQ